MKFTQASLLPLVAVTAAFVIPDEQITHQLAFEDNKDSSFLDSVKERLNHAVEYSESLLDSALDAATSLGKKAANSIESYDSMVKFETQQWLDSITETINDAGLSFKEGPHHPHHPPHHPPHRGPPNQTVYQLISGSKYTTKLAELIDENPDLVKALNGTAANYTVFAPIDSAFDKLPKHKKPSKEIIEKVLAYHVSPHLYPAGRVVASHTIPTTYNASSLGGHPQRLRVGFGLRGLAVNFYARIVGINIFGTNGVIHALDSVLFLPPDALQIVGDLPGEFSTLQLALIKTGLGEEIEKSHHEGGTLFAPSNTAFQKLGVRINHFLFSKPGQKYLKALLKYHIVANQTLYTDAFYRSDQNKEASSTGHLHFDLPTLLKDKNLSVDIGSWGAFATIKINAFSTVTVADGIASDGVIQVVSNVLIPPRTPGDHSETLIEDMDLEDFKERLIPTTYAQEL